MIESEAGMSAAAPRPATARPAIRTIAVGARAAIAEPPAKSPAPASKIRRRP